MKLKRCKWCGSNMIGVYRVHSTRQWVATCNFCHYMGFTKLFKFRAIRTWNKEMSQCL